MEELGVGAGETNSYKSVLWPEVSENPNKPKHNSHCLAEFLDIPWYSYDPCKQVQGPYVPH